MRMQVPSFMESLEDLEEKILEELESEGSPSRINYGDVEEYFERVIQEGITENTLRLRRLTEEEYGDIIDELDPEDQIEYQREAGNYLREKLDWLPDPQ